MCKCVGFLLMHCCILFLNCNHFIISKITVFAPFTGQQEIKAETCNVRRHAAFSARGQLYSFMVCH